MAPLSSSPKWSDRLRDGGAELARALRIALKRPTFSLVAIATLGIGIGASTATFSIADAVLRRTREIGVRMALGADQRAVFTYVMRHALTLTAGAAAIGLLVAALLRRAIGSLLFEIAPFDPFTVAATLAAVTTAAAVAALLPARRATRVNPLIALQAD
jgi:putative ABC transport system permease protein